MEHEHPRLYSIMDRHRTRVGILAFYFLVAGTIAVYTAVTTFLPPEVRNSRKLFSKKNSQEILPQLIVTDGTVLKWFLEAESAGVPIFYGTNDFNAFVFVCTALFYGFLFVCLLITIRLIRYLKANSHTFSERTYKLQRQLILSLQAQVGAVNEQ